MFKVDRREETIELTCPHCENVGLKVAEGHTPKRVTVRCPSCSWHAEGPRERLVNDLQASFYGP